MRRGLELYKKQIKNGFFLFLIGILDRDICLSGARGSDGKGDIVAKVGEKTITADFYSKKLVLSNRILKINMGIRYGALMWMERLIYRGCKKLFWIR